jgi:hypothetical protein
VNLVCIVSSVVLVVAVVVSSQWGCDSTRQRQFSPAPNSRFEKVGTICSLATRKKKRKRKKEVGEL